MFSEAKFVKCYTTTVLFLVLLYCAVSFLALFFGIFPLHVRIYLILLAGGIAVFGSAVRFVSGKRKMLASRDSLLGASLCISIGIAIVLQRLFMQDEIDHLGRSAQSFITSGFVISLAWMIVGAAVGKIKMTVSNAVSFSLVVAVLSFCFYGLGAGGGVDYQSLPYSSQSRTWANHLYVGEAAVVCLALAFSVARPRMKVWVGLVSLLALFMLGGRAALIGFLAAMILFFMVFYERKRYGKFFNLAIILVFSVCAIGVVIEHGSSPGIDRMVLAGGVEGDGSIKSRFLQFEHGVEGLLSQSLLGDAGWIVRDMGSIGAYMHNVLSVWQFYGLVPFMLYVCVLLVCVKKAFSRRGEKLAPVETFALLMLLYSFVAVLVAKEGMFTLAWFAFGIWLTGMRIGVPQKRSWGGLEVMHKNTQSHLRID